MRGRCEKDIGEKVTAFTQHLKSTNLGEKELTSENVELLNKFASFLQQQKHGHMHGHLHGKHDSHGKFGKHGHHGMFGHHFGRHGPYGRHHGHHGHGHHGHGKHESHGWHKNEMCSGKHHGKHFWKHIAMCNTDEIIVIDDDIERNPSPPTTSASVTNAVEQSSEGNNGNVCDCKSRHGRRWYNHKRAIDQEADTNSSQTDEPQEDNLTTMVENITIENSANK